jgi:hypothetical protein
MVLNFHKQQKHTDMNNQIFKPSRFLAYTRYNLVQDWKKKAITAAGLMLTFIFFIFNSINAGWGENNVEAISIGTMSIMAFVICSTSFPAFRKRDRTMHFITVPASNIEKFSSELLLRFGTLLVLIPLLITLVGNTVLSVYENIHNVSLFSRFSFGACLADNNLEGNMMSFIILGILLFTGASVFKKNPLIKTIIFIGSVAAIIAYYLFQVMSKILPNIDGLTLQYNLESSLEGGSGIIIAIVGLWSLTYAFFKVKEKEA